MASIWKGAITFGLVSVPVELHTAVRDSRISFHLLHEKDESPIHYKRVREDTGDEVPWGEIVKAYEVSKGDYVVLDAKDFESAAVKQDDTLDIADFADAGEVDPRFYEGVYFLVAGKGGARAYALLRDALAKTNTVGIGRIIIRQKQHVAEVRASGDSLMLMLMRFAEELVDPKQYDFPAHTAAKSKELDMAVQLVESLKSPFDPSRYVDTYDANLRKIIEAKSKGRRVSLKADRTAKQDPKVVDLMSRLQKSLKTGARKTATTSRTTTRARKRKTA
jgi:DNA end-binding protein Ku